MEVGNKEKENAGPEKQYPLTPVKIPKDKWKRFFDLSGAGGLYDAHDEKGIMDGMIMTLGCADHAVRKIATKRRRTDNSALEGQSLEAM